MNRIEKTFKSRKPFIAYITAGDGGIDYTVECCKALVKGGVDILEIGLPFSDPIADGPIIQRAHQRALERRTTFEIVLEGIRRIRQEVDVPIVVFSYCNPLIQKGAAYLYELKNAGVDALLVVDLSDSEIEGDLIPIMLAAPSTSDNRLAAIGRRAEGFLYYVSQKGTTGVRNQLAGDFPTQMRRIKSYTTVPVVAGFGIADKASARTVLEHADGFVVGSAIVKKMEEKVEPGVLDAFAQSLDPR